MNRRISQQGSMLLEGLIAILIFSFGILALVGMQASSIRAVAGSKHRTDAALLAEKLVSHMWVAKMEEPEVKNSFVTGGAAYEAWANEVSDVHVGLPGATGDNAPTVSVADDVWTIRVKWQAPGEPAAHEYVLMTGIGRISP